MIKIFVIAFALTSFTAIATPAFAGEKERVRIVKPVTQDLTVSQKIERYIGKSPVRKPVVIKKKSTTKKYKRGVIPA